MFYYVNWVNYVTFLNDSDLFLSYNIFYPLYLHRYVYYINCVNCVYAL